MATRFSVVLPAAVYLAAFPVVPAWAIAGLSVPSDFPSTVYVGDGPLEASLSFGDEIYGDNDRASIKKVTLIPSRRTFPSKLHLSDAAVRSLRALTPPTLPAPGGNFTFTVDIANVGTVPVRETNVRRAA